MKSRIGFFDFTGWDYTPATLSERPLGGSQSALCYLARELAALGHAVTIVNGVRTISVHSGVMCAPLKLISADFLSRFDVIVLQNLPKQASEFRPLMNDRAPLLFWTQHATDQPAVQSLAQANARNALDGISYVSRWQQDSYQAAFGPLLPPAIVLRNAVAPPFASLWNGKPILPGMTPATFAYTSTPFRGLNWLLAAFPHIRHASPNASLDVYSSLQVYQIDSAADQAKHGALYDACRSTAGVRYIGSLPQPELASRLRGARYLCYPNHFAETSCIAVMEAMAAGCQIITSKLGALPETAAGFATLVDIDAPAEQCVRRFVDATIAAMNHAERNPAAVEDQLQRQVRYVQNSLTWPARAREWEAWFATHRRRRELTLAA